jgi:hypothetical protein
MRSGARLDAVVTSGRQASASAALQWAAVFTAHPPCRTLLILTVCRLGMSTRLWLLARLETAAFTNVSAALPASLASFRTVGRSRHG